jgi:hypothetical protein
MLWPVGGRKAWLIAGSLAAPAATPRGRSVLKGALVLSEVLPSPCTPLAQSPSGPCPATLVGSLDHGTPVETAIVWMRDAPGLLPFASSIPRARERWA